MFQSYYDTSGHTLGTAFTGCADNYTSNTALWRHRGVAGLATANANSDISTVYALKQTASGDTDLNACLSRSVSLSIAKKNQVVLSSGVLRPAVNSALDLGSTSFYYRNLYSTSATISGSASVGSQLNVGSYVQTNAVYTNTLNTNTVVFPTAPGFNGKTTSLNNDSKWVAAGSDIGQFNNDKQYVANGSSPAFNALTLTNHNALVLKGDNGFDSSLTTPSSQLTMYSPFDAHIRAASQDFLFGSNGAGYCNGGWNKNSDARLKRDIVTLDPAACYRDVMQLRPVEYSLRSRPEDRCVGYIAQEVRAVAATAVSQNRDMLSVEYDQVHVLTTAAVQHLACLCQQQQETISSLTRRLEHLERRIH